MFSQLEQDGVTAPAPTRWADDVARENRELHRLRALEQRALRVRDAEQPAELTVTRDFLASFLDPDPCWFDHHGGCQAHGYLELEPGEICPQKQLQDLLEEAT
jgi:hypothetical protein